MCDNFENKLVEKLQVMDVLFTESKYYERKCEEFVKFKKNSNNICQWLDFEHLDVRRLYQFQMYLMDDSRASLGDGWDGGHKVAHGGGHGGSHGVGYGGSQKYDFFNIGGALKNLTRKTRDFEKYEGKPIYQYGFSYTRLWAFTEWK